MSKIGKVIETLQCAEINCDNVPKLGVKFAEFVKIQIQDAINQLEEIEAE